MRTRIALALSSALLAIGLGASPSYAKKSGLTPAKVKQAKRQRLSYEQCRKAALAGMKKPGADQRRLEGQLAACKDNFPGASLYIACKKAAIRTARAKGMAEAEAAGQCKRYLTATAFDPKGDLPFFTEAGQLFFAGIGMNRAQPTSSLRPPNFDCSRFAAATRAPKTAEYLLFGNHPRTFSGLAELDAGAAVKALGIGSGKQDGTLAKGFGKIYGDPKGSAAVAYFPAAACDFAAEPGDVFAGLTVYYLLDQVDSSATPYFGIAYYRDDQAQATAAKILKAILAALGPGYKPISKNKHVTFVAADDMPEADDEGDPKNLCRPPRAHQLVAVLQAQKAQPTRPEYLILANVRNLCEFGDRLSKRLAD